MATTVSGLSEYVFNHRDELITKASLDAKTLRYVEIMPNVKWKDALNFLDSTITLQDGGSCGFNPTGSDLFREKYIETNPIKIEKEWCFKDWEKSFANYQLMWTAGRVSIPFEETIVDSNLAKIQEAVEDLVWKGSASLNVEGFISGITYTESASTIEVSGLTSASTIVEKIDAVVAAIPQKALKKGVYVFLSYSDLRAYILAQNAVCCANRQIQDAAVEELKYVGDSRVTLVPVYGLEGTGYIVAAPADALVWATDVENASNEYRVWENEEDEKVRFRVLFRGGTAIKYPDEVVFAK